MTDSVDVFDELAPHYDVSFTQTTIGSLMRRAVWRRLDARFGRDDHILELNCGTGEDALHLARRGVRVLATDASSKMISVARDKIAGAGLDDRVAFRCMSIDQFAADRAADLKIEMGEPSGFGGVLSNFGGLNCIQDLERFGTALSSYVRPGAFAMLCIMGPAVPWEWVWYLGRGRPGRALRRFRRGGVRWHGIDVRYPSIRTVRRVFEPAFRSVRVNAIGALVPPPYTESLTAGFPRLLRLADRWERRLENVFPLPWLADYYLIEFQRRTVC